jgi:YVTN family beta-propeller protein
MVASAAAQSIVATLDFRPPGVTNSVGFDFEITVVNSTGLVYVGSTAAYGEEVAAVDPSTGTVVAVIPIPTPGSLSFARANQTTGLVYFRQDAGANVVVIDGRPASPTFNTALPSIPFAGQQIQSFALDETRGLLYVTNNTVGVAPLQSRVAIIDADPASPTFHTVLSEVLLPPNALARGVAVNSVTNKVYLGVSGGGVGGVHVLDGAALTLTQIAGTVAAFGVVVNESTNLVYATAAGNNLNAVDGATDTVLAVIPLGALIQVVASDERLAVNTVTDRVYIRSHDVAVPGKVVVVDGDPFSPTFHTVLALIDVGRAQGSVDLVVDETFNRILTTGFLDLETAIIDGSTNTVVATLPSTQIPSDIALNPLTHQAFTANQLNFVRVIDVPTASATATILTGVELGLGLVNPNNNRYYFPVTTDVSDVRLSDKNGTADFVTGLPTVSGRYLFSAINRQTNRIYVDNISSNVTGTTFSLPGFVSVIDGATNTVLATVNTNNQPFGLAVNETTDKVYAVAAGLPLAFPAGIAVIDGPTNSVTQADVSAFPVTARFLAPTVVNEAANRLYFLVTGAGATTVGVLDGFTNVATPLPAAFGPLNGFAVSNSLNRTYLASADAGVVNVLDGSDTLVATIATGSPVALALNNATGRLYAANVNDDTVSVIDTATNTVVATIPVGDEPAGVAVNELTHRVYVQNRADVTVSFIDGSTNSVTATLALPDPTSFRSWTLDADPATSRVYASQHDDNGQLAILCDAGATAAALRQAILDATAGDPPGIRRSLLAKLDNAEAARASGNFGAAANQLSALANEVRALTGRFLTSVEAERIQALIAAVANAEC